MLRDASGLDRGGYLRRFRRANLVGGPWSAAAGRDAARALRGDLEGGVPRTVVVLGRDVARAMGLSDVLVHPQRRGPVTYRVVPHPSGRCRWYNEPLHRVVVGLLLEEMAHAEQD